MSPTHVSSSSGLAKAAINASDRTECGPSATGQSRSLAVRSRSPKARPDHHHSNGRTSKAPNIVGMIG